MSYYKNRFYQRNINKEFTNETLIGNYQSMKLFTILYFNDFCFEWQLTKKFNLTKSQVQKSTENLDKLGFISFRLFSELSELMQEAIMKITPNFDKIYKENPKVYVITPNGKKEGKNLISKTLKSHLGNQGFYDFLQEVNKWSKIFRITKKKIKTEEETYLTRFITFPNGITVEKSTQKQFNLVLDIYLGLQDLKDNSNSSFLNNSGSSSILAIKDKLKHQLNQSKDYQGIYSHLTNSEMNLFTREVSNIEVKTLNKEIINEARLIRQRKDLTWSVMRGDKLNPKLMDEDFKKGNIFLSVLWSSLK